MKKIFVFILTFIFTLSLMSVSVFANDDQTGYSNFTASVSPINSDCVHYDDAKVIVKITKDNDVAVDAELVYDPEFEEYSFEGNVDGANDIINDVGDEYDAMFDSDEYVDVLKDAGYKIEIIVEDNDPDPEFIVDEIDYYILTKASIEATANMLANYMVVLIIEELGDDPDVIAELNKMFGGEITVKDEVAYIGDKEVTFQDLLNAYNTVPDSEVDEETKAAIEEYEAMIEAMEKGEYAGELIVEAFLDCSCAIMDEYTVCHEFYDVNGEYVDEEYVKCEVAEGETVKVSDLEVFTEYKGKKYEIEGYYIYDWDADDWDYDDPIEEFRVYDGYEEILVKYVEVPAGGQGEGVVDPEGSKPSDGNNGEPAKPVDKVSDTGDDFNALPFAAVMLLAALGMGAAVVRRRA